jgi:hypothetical protein
MYLIQDSAGKSAAVVDPYNAAGMQQEVEKQGVKVRLHGLGQLCKIDRSSPD